MLQFLFSTKKTNKRPLHTHTHTNIYSSIYKVSLQACHKKKKQLDLRSTLNLIEIGKKKKYDPHSRKNILSEKKVAYILQTVQGLAAVVQQTARTGRTIVFKVVL